MEGRPNGIWDLAQIYWKGELAKRICQCNGSETQEKEEMRMERTGMEKADRGRIWSGKNEIILGFRYSHVIIA